MDGEPEIIINGQRLSRAQTTAVRVACTQMFDDYSADPDVLGTDSAGRSAAKAYRDRLGEVVGMMSADGESEVV